MSGVDHARFCSAFDTLVNSVNTAVTKYNNEVAQCLNGGEYDELKRWLNENRPHLRPLVTGIPNVQQWATNARLGLSQTNHVVGNGNKPALSNSSALSSCDSDLDSNSGESMAVLDRMIGDMQEDLGEPLLDVFDDHSDGAHVPVRLPSVQQPSPVEEQRVNREAGWERSYHLLQNALIKHHGIDGLYAAGQNKQVSGKEQASIQSALEWSDQQREMRKQNKLSQEQTKLLDSLCTRRLWSWGSAEKASHSRPPSAQSAQSGQKRGTATPPTTGDASSRPLRDLDNRAPFPIEPPSTTVLAARRNANKAILRKVTAQINRVKKRDASHKKQDDEWLKYFALLMEYDAMHGTFQVAEDALVRDSKGNVCALGVWLSAQLAAVNEYVDDYPIYYSALTDLFATGRLWVREDSRAASPEQANVGSSSSTAPALSVTASRATPGNASSRGPSPAPAPRTIPGAGTAETRHSGVGHTSGDGSYGHNAAGEGDNSPGGTACSSPELGISPAHASALSAPASGLSRAGDDPGLELLLAAARKAVSASASITGTGAQRASAGSRGVGDGAGGGTAPSTPPGTKRKASPSPLDARGSGNILAASLDGDGHRSKKAGTSTVAPIAATAAHPVTSHRHSDSRPPSATTLPNATRGASHTTTATAPTAAVSLRDKHLFQPRPDSAFQEVGVSLPMPTLAGAKSRHNTTSSVGAGKSDPSNTVATQCASPAVPESGTHRPPPSVDNVPTPKRAKSPVTLSNAASTASNSGSNGKDNTNNTVPPVSAPATTLPTGPRQRPSPPVAVPPSASTSAVSVEAASNPYRPPSVPMLKDEFAAFVYSDAQSRMVFGIGRVLPSKTPSETTADGGQWMTVRLLTPRDSSDPVSTRYQENVHTDPVLAIKSALARGLRMDEDRHAVYSLKLTATSRTLLQLSYDAIKTVLT